MASKPCKEGTIAIPKHFMEQQYVRETSRFGQFIIKEGKRKDKYKSTQTVSFTKLQLLTDVILDEEKDIEEYLELIQDVSRRGFVYEALWDVVILLEYLQEYKDDYKFYPYKIESGDVLSDTKLNIKTYLEKEQVISGNSRGVSDITLVKNSNSQKTDGWACSQSLLPDISKSKIDIVFFSSKYFSKEKDIGKYDIAKIDRVGQDITKKINGEDTDKSFKINLLVKDKNEFLKKFENARAQQKGYHGTFQNVYDLGDLCNIIQQIRDNKDAIIKMLDEQEMRAKKNKPYLIPRFHQLLFVLKSLDILCQSTGNGFAVNDDVKKRRVLWGQIPRSGKTYTAGLLVSKLYKGGFFDNKSRNCVLVITPAPKETIDQFTTELFKKYKDFDDFEVLQYDSKLYKALEEKRKVLQKDIRYIFVASKQYLQATKKKTYDEEDEEAQVDEDNIKKQCKYLKGRISILFFDEIHYGGSTNISNKILNAIDPNHNALHVFLTATYKKPVMWYDIVSHQLMLWGIDDIKLCKKISYVGVLDKFEDKYGSNYIQRTLNELCLTYNSTMADMFMRIEEEYNKYPDIHFITTTFTEEAITLLKKPSVYTEYGFDINSLFSMEQYQVDGKKEHRFQDEDNVTRLLSIVEHKIDTSVMPILQEYNASQKHVFTSQLWFLPFFKGNKIANMAELVKKLIEKKGLFMDYKIITLVKANEDKNTVKQEEMNAWREGKKGLIILVGKKLSLGVSLPCTDLVLFLNNDSEVDVIYQRMFRSLTERDGKRVGFVMDMNPIRTISATLDYSFSPEKFQNGKRPNVDEMMEKLKYMMENNVIYIDADVLELSDKGTDKRIELYSSLDKLLRDTEYIRVTRALDENINNHMENIFQDFNMKEWNDLIPTRDKKKLKELLTGPNQAVPSGKPGNPGNTGDDRVEQIEADIKKDEKLLYKIKKTIMNVWKDIIVITSLMVSSSALSSGSGSGSGSGSSRYSNTSNFIELLERLTGHLEAKPYSDINTCSTEDDKQLEKIDRFLKQLFCIKIKPLLVFEDDNKEAYFTRRILKMMKDFLKDDFKKNEMNKIFENSKMVLMNIDNKNIRELHAYVEKYLSPKEHEKKEYGEVFTPLSLVEEMLGAITKYADKNFWKNPDLKILDPAAGIGNFPLIAYEKLMDGLKVKIPNEERRRKHILENMLYMIELNPVNTRIMKRIFNSKKYNLNIIQGDALKENTHHKLFKMAGTEKFDLIMGNPPYQGVQKADIKRGGGVQIWPSFIKLYITQLIPKGYMVYVHPSGWRKPVNFDNSNSQYEGLYELMVKQNCMHYLEIHNTTDGQRVFQSGTRYDWYVLQNTSCDKKTCLKDETGKVMDIQLKSIPFLPNYNVKEVFSLLAKKNEETCKIIFNASAYETPREKKKWVRDDEWIKKHPKEAKGYKKVLIHSTPKEGVRYMWTNDFTKDKAYNTPMFGIPKVIFGETGIYDPIIDRDGRYGMTQGAMALQENPENLEKLAEYLSGEKFKKILDSCQWSNFRIDWRLFKYFKKDFWKTK